MSRVRVARMKPKARRQHEADGADSVDLDQLGWDEERRARRR
jgi:hypothetical protein